MTPQKELDRAWGMAHLERVRCTVWQLRDVYFGAWPASLPLLKPVWLPHSQAGSYFPPHCAGSQSEHRIKSELASHRERVTQGKCQRQSHGRDSSNTSGGVLPCCTLLTDSVKGGRGVCSSQGLSLNSHSPSCELAHRFTAAH